MKYILASVVVFCVSLGPLCGMELAHHGAAGAVIIVDPAATATEVYAAQQLAANLKEITGANFVVRTDTHAPSRAIVVGQGTAAEALFHDVPFGKLDGEEWVIRTKGEPPLAGGRTAARDALCGQPVFAGPMRRALVDALGQPPFRNNPRCACRA